MAVAVVLLSLLAALFAVPCARLSERLAIILAAAHGGAEDVRRLGEAKRSIRPLKPSYPSRPESELSAALETAERSARG